MSGDKKNWRDDSLLLAGRLLVGVLILVAFGGLVMAYELFQSEESYWSAILLSISASVISYLVTLLLHSSILEQRQRAAFFEGMEQQISESYSKLEKETVAKIGSVADDVKQAIADSDKETFSYISKRFPDLIPGRVFPPSDLPLQSFVEAWDAHAETSSKYVFRGVTARHIAPFLSRTNPQNLSVHVYLLDPREEEQIWLYCRALNNSESADTSSKSEQIEAVRRQIYFGILSLIDAAQYCPISIKFHSGGVFYRTEIFDDTVLVSFLTAKNKTRYPAVYSYGAGSIYYDAFVADIAHLEAIDMPALTLRPNSTVDELWVLLEQIGFEGDKEELTAAAEAFKAELFAKAT